MIRDALARDGRLTRDKILIDSTSGNTGVAYSLFGAALGVRVRLVMPSNVSKARKDIARASAPRSSSATAGGLRRRDPSAREIVAEDPDDVLLSRPVLEPSNWRAHYDGTGAKILEAWATGSRTSSRVSARRGR